ncbi:MAG: hypothetical protein AB7O68_12185, partial [Pirellulales bacterium]
MERQRYWINRTFDPRDDRDAVFAADTYGDGQLRLARETTAFRDDSRAASEVHPSGLEPLTFGSV